MRALTVMQPWANAIAHDGKTVENRTWRRDHRGPIAIHAGAGWSQNGEGILAEILRRPTPDRAWFPTGCVIAVATVTDIHEAADCCEPWGFASGFHWVLADVMPLADRVPCKGALGLWTLPDDVAAKVEQQLAVAR